MLIAIITGASSGLGREYVHALDREGLDEIWVIARRKERLQELAEKTITPLRILACDLTEPAVLHAISAELEKNHPIVNYLINAAGFGKIGSFADIPTEELCAMIDLNCRAAVALTQMSIPYMPPTGGILNLCSCAAFQPIPFLNVYAASKAFLLHYTRALHAELLPKGIHVTARRSLEGLEKNAEVVTPGIIPFLHRALAGLLPHSIMMRASERFHAMKS